MKTQLTALSAAALMLVLTACGGGGQERIDELEAEVESLRAQLDAVQASEGGDLFNTDDLGGRMDGDIQAVIGEAIEVDLGPYEDNNPYAGTVALIGIEFSSTCVSNQMAGDTEETEAQFAFLTFEVEVDSDFDDELSFNSNSFRWNDWHYALSTPTSLNCELDLGHQDPFEPGDSGQYTAIWEVPTTSAELQWRAPSYTVTWHIDGDEGETGAAEESQDSGSDDSESQDEAESSSDGRPHADDIDFYGPIDDISELEADISTLSDCETADTIWGSLMNAELEGLEIDHDYLSDLEDWMVDNGCW